MTARRVLVTGCSGGGKSSLLGELARRGFAVCEEPGRQIVREQEACGGAALPWANIAAFADLCARRSIANLAQATAHGGVTFFDRGLIDAVLACERLGLPLGDDIAAAFATQRYDATVFVAPPWPEIFAPDAERRHGLDAARAEYEYILKRLPELAYAATLLPKAPVEARADFVLTALGLS